LSVSTKVETVPLAGHDEGHIVKMIQVIFFGQRRHLFCFILKSNTMSNSHESHSLSYFIMVYVVIFTSIAALVIASETFFIK